MDFDRIADKISHQGSVRTAGKIEFVKDQGPVRRDLRDSGFNFDSDAHKNLAKILWASQRAHSYAMAAYRIMSKMSSSQFSPDGLLGGKGYIQTVKDMRGNLSGSVEALSTFSDTVYDEINAPHWKVADSDAGVSDIVESTENVKENPAQYVENEYEQEVYQAPDAGLMNPSVESNDDDDDGGNPYFNQPPSAAPDGSGAEGYFQSQTSSNYDAAIARVVRASTAGGNSSIPVETLPGPRVDAVGPGEGDAWMGAFNDEEDAPTDGIEEEYEVGDWDPIVDQDQQRVSPYYDPTKGDESTYIYTFDRDERSTYVYSFDKRADGYSQLPGANNDRPLDWYRPGLTEEELEYMRSIADPSVKEDPKLTQRKELNEDLWSKDMLHAF
jgi:hypothetical protein